MDKKEIQKGETVEPRDDGSVNEIAVKVANHPEPRIEGVEVKHLGQMRNDEQVKRRI